MKLKTDEPNIYNTLSLIDLEQGKLVDALRMIDKAIALAPDQPYFINNRGYIYLQLNELEKAEADINQSIAADPYNGWAYRNKGIYYLMKKDYKSAIRLLKQAESMDSFIDRIYFYLASAYMKDGNEIEACSAFKKSIERKDSILTAPLVMQCD
jgi:tetratricopeptide (TPR) repeat protein